MMVLTTSPLTKTLSVGIEVIPYFMAIAASSSVLSFTTLILPACSVAISSTIGPTARHGPHHSAQKSTRTGVDQIGKLSLVGAGMRSHPGITAQFFACLSEAGVNIEMISTSEIRISIICRESDLDKGVRAAHTAFGLDAEHPEAVVYGGTGR